MRERPKRIRAGTPGAPASLKGEHAQHRCVLDAAYFRNARVIERSMAWEMESAGLMLHPVPVRKLKLSGQEGFRLREGRLELDAVLPPGIDPAEEPEIVLQVFVAIAKTGAALAQDREMRIARAIPVLGAHLEDGPGLWRSLSAILADQHTGAALRTMHALGMLDLILPEFHGIDALVIRDAYHRYTVDEHTFVLIDTLHGLETAPSKNAAEWRMKFGLMARELQCPELLYMAALLHDTGKGRAGPGHAKESAVMARAVLGRLEMDSYDMGPVPADRDASGDVGRRCGGTFSTRKQCGYSPPRCRRRRCCGC